MSHGPQTSHANESSHELKHTINAWLLVAIGPFLIMLLIGSLIFFLIEVSYAGEYPGRVKYIFLLYTFAIVLVGRISIDEGHGYAALFGVPLAIVTLFVAGHFLQLDRGSSTISSLLLVTFVGLIWFAADRLTWDCTVVDFSQDVSNEGLLSTVRKRLSGQAEPAVEEPPHADKPEPPPTNDSPAGATRAKASGWARVQEDTSWEAAGRPADRPQSDLHRRASEYGLDEQGNVTDPQKFHAHEPLDGSSSREQSPLGNWRSRLPFGKRKQNSPGVWVLYFSLAAVPIFGFGQSLVPASMGDVRQRMFWQFVTYTLAALGLLMTTSLLGLQRYLRQRQVTVPNSVAVSWLAAGAILILLILSVAWILPRPAPEYSLLQKPLQWVSSEKLKPSRYGWGSEGQEQPGGNTADPEAKSGAADGDSSANRSGGKTSGDASSGSGQSSQSGSSGSSTSQSQSGQKSQSNSSQDSGSSGQSGNQQSGQSRSQSQSSSSSESTQQNRSNSSSSDSSNQSSGGDSASPSQDGSSEQSSGESGAEGNKASSQGESENSSGESSNESGQNRESPSQEGEQNRSSSNQSQARGSSQSRSNQSAKSQADRNRAANSPENRNESRAPNLGSVFSFLAGLGKWLMVLLLLVLLAWACFYYRRELWEAWQQFLQRLRELWERLFGGKPQPNSTTSAGVAATSVSHPPRAFSTFRNPYQTGQAEQWSAEELLAYSLAALEAWGRERQCPREADETPREFARSLRRVDREVASEARRMAELYGAVAFGPRPPRQLPAGSLAKLWKLMGQAPHRSGSAATANTPPSPGWS